MKFNILSIDETGITRLELSSILRSLDINFISAENEIEALNVLEMEYNNINAIIWTMNSTNPEDLKAIRRIKSKDTCKQIPIIIVSGYTDKKYIIKAIEAGAVEYIAKPYDEDTVLRKVCKILGLSYEKTIRSNIDDDIVTYNFSEMFSREIKSASRGNHHLSIMLISVVPEESSVEYPEDIENIIKLIKRIVKTRFRETDTVFHFGVNNLLLLLPFADKPGMKSIEEKILDTFNNHSLIKRKNNGYKLTMASVTFPEDGKVKDNLLEKLENEFNKRSK